SNWEDLPPEPELCHAHARPTPAQDKVRTDIERCREEIELYEKLAKSNIGLNEIQKGELKTLRNKLENSKRRLKTLQINRMASAKKRAGQKTEFEVLKSKHPEHVDELNKFKRTNPKIGRPAIELKQPGLLKAILDIVSANTMADARRRCETLRTGFTLKQVLEELHILAEYDPPRCLQDSVEANNDSHSDDSEDEIFPTIDESIATTSQIPPYPAALHDLEDIIYSEKWKFNHIQQSQSLNTKIGSVTAKGIQRCDSIVDEAGRFYGLSTRIALSGLDTDANVAFDKYCPSLQGKLSQRICKDCGKYFVTQIATKAHRIGMHVSDFASDNHSWHEVVEAPLNACESDEIQVIEDIQSWLSPVFVDSSEIFVDAVQK
ncbi:unnamed protein product, partial [Allacma fusca]